MNKSIRFVFIIGIVAFTLIGCGTAPTPTPAATQPPIQITVVVTAVPPPVTATPPPQPSPSATLVVATTAPVTPTVAVPPTRVAVINTPRPAATRTPTKPAVAPTNTALPIKYAAPKLIGPKWNDDTGKGDERHFPADALIFQWESITGLGSDECYLVTVSFEPGARDGFLTGCGNSFTKEVPRNAAEFKLNRPFEAGPNYGGLNSGNVGEFWAYWWVTVVKNNGTGANGKPLTVPLSPDSAKFKFLMKGN